MNVSKAIYKPSIPLSFLFWLYPDQNDINKKPFFKKIIKMIKEAKKSESLKDFSDAEEIYHKALMHLHLYEKEANVDALEVSQARSYLFDSMADMAMRQGRWDKAEVLYKNVMTELLVNQNFMKDDNALIEISLKLAMIYGEQGKNDVATMGYEYCIESLENKINSDKKNVNGEEKKEENEDDNMDIKKEVDTNTLTLYGICLDSFANFLYCLNNVSKALTYFEKALQVSLSVLGGCHSQICVIYNSIGVIYSDFKNYQKATEFLEKAIEMGEKCEATDLGVYYFNLAEVKRQMGLREEALLCYKRAHIAASQHPELKATLDKINEALKKMDKD